MGCNKFPGVYLLMVRIHNPQRHCVEIFARYLITSLAKEEVTYLLGKGGYVFSSIGLSVCLSVCGHYSKTYERIRMKFCGGVLGSTMKN